MELYRKVRHAYFKQGMSKRAIARYFGISRDSVDEIIVYAFHPATVGPSGTGKTHVALGLGLAACQKGLSVGFTAAGSSTN